MVASASSSNTQCPSAALPAAAAHRAPRSTASVRRCVSIGGAARRRGGGRQSRRASVDPNLVQARREQRPAAASTGPDGTFDGGGQAGRGPIARQARDLRAACALPGRSRSCAGVAAKVARFSLTTRQRRHRLGQVQGGAHVRPDRRRRSASAASSTRRLAALIVTETWPGLTNTHSAMPPISPMNPASPGSAADREMHVEDGLELGPAPRVRAAGRRDPGAAPPAPRRPPGRAAAPSVVSSAATRPPSMRKRGDPAAGPHRRRPARASVATAGSISVSDQPARGKAGMQDAPPRPSVSSTTAASSVAAPTSGARVERGDGERLDQAAVERAGPQQPGDGRVWLRPPEREQRQVVARARAGDAAAGVENPPGQPPGARPQRPALAGREIEEREQRPPGTAERVPRADPVEDTRRPRDCRRAAGGCRCRPGSRVRGRNRTGSARPAAAPPRGRPTAVPGIAAGDRRRQPGEAGADDVRGPDQAPGLTRARTAARATASASAGRLTRCRRRPPAARAPAAAGSRA